MRIADGSEVRWLSDGQPARVVSTDVVYAFLKALFSVFDSSLCCGPLGSPGGGLAGLTTPVVLLETLASSKLLVEFLPFDVMVRLWDRWAFFTVTSAGCGVCGLIVWFQHVGALLTSCWSMVQNLLGGGERVVIGSGSHSVAAAARICPMRIAGGWLAGGTS